MENICNLYQQSLIPNTEIVKEATDQLLSIYENPENISLIFQVINDSSDNTIKQSALTGLYKMMNAHWKSAYNGNQNGEAIKEHLLNLFRNFKSNNLISNLLAYCFKPIIETQGWEWSELNKFLSQTISESTLIVVSFLLKQSLENSEDLNQEIIEFCLSILEKSLNKNDTHITICSSKVFALLSSFLQQEYSEIFVELMNTYFTLFSENPNTDLANSLCSLFNSNNLSIDSDSILMRLIELSTQSDPQIFFIVIRKLVSKFGTNLRDRFPFLLHTTIEIISSLFSDECFLPENDSNYIAGVAEKCVKVCNKDDFSSLIIELFSSSSKDIQYIFSMLEITHNIIDSININSPLYNCIMELISESMNVDNHTIIELTLICIIDLICEQTELFENNAEDIFKAVLPKFDIKHQPIIENASKVLSLIMYHYKISQEILSPVIKTFIQAAEETTGSMRANMLTIIYGIVFQLQEDVGPFIPSIIPVILNCMNDPDEEVQCRVLEALGYSILYAPNECESIIEEAMQLFIKSLEKDELVDSAFLALQCAAKSTIGVDPFIELAILHAIKLANSDEQTIIALTNIQSAINFMNMALKYRPKACHRFRLVIIGCCLANISDEDIDEDILADALMAIARALDGMEIPQQITEAFLSIPSSKNKLAVRAIFKTASYILKKNDSSDNDEFIFKMMQFAISAFERELPCQLLEKNDDQILSNYDKDLFDMIFRFLNYFAEKRADSFPSSQFLDLIISLKGKVSKYETEISLSPFVSLKNTLNQPNEIDSQLFELAASLASENCLTRWPFTLLRIIININDIGGDQIEQIIGLCMSKIDSILSALSLLFVLASKNSFEFAPHLQKMIDSIPKKIELIAKRGEIEDITIIFNSIFKIIEKFPGIEKGFENDLFTKCAFTINKYKKSLPDDTTKLILQFIVSMISNDEKLTLQLSENYPYVCSLIEEQ